MKIVQVQTQAEAAGAQRISDMVGKGLRERGHDVRTVFMYRKTEAYDHDPYADFVLKTPPRGAPGQLRTILGLMSYLRAHRPDVVITYQYWGNIFGSIGSRLAGVRHVIANQNGRPMTRGALGLASKIDRVLGATGMYDEIVVNSGWANDQFGEHPQSYRKRIRRIDHGVVRASTAIGKQAAREAFNLPADVPLVVSTGRQTKDKNQIVLVKALEQLDGVHLALAGAGPSQEEFIETAERINARDRLHLVGEIVPDRVLDFVAAGDVFAFPSLFETFGLSVVEAAISGVPVVANDLPVLAEVLHTSDGEPAALFASSRDVDAFAGAIRRVLDDKDLAGRLSAAGRSLAERYSEDAMCAAYDRLLKA